MQKIRKKYHWPNAYLSLEACLIMPMVFYCIFFVIYVGVYQYNRCLLCQDIYRLLIRGSQVKFADNAEVVQRLQEEDAKWYYAKYMWCKFGKKTIEVDHGTIHLVQDAVLTVVFPVLAQWTGRESWKIHEDVTGGRIRPTDTIRNCRRLEKVLERRKRDA